MKPNHDIDPRTTRRTVPLHEYKRNSALYAQYELIGYDDWTNHDGTPGSVVLQKKPEFCHPQKQQHDDPDDTASGLDAEREKEVVDYW